MKAKLFILLSSVMFLNACAGYDNAFCRGDYCTDTSYLPTDYSNNADYDCGKRGYGFNCDSASGSCATGQGNSGFQGGSSCSGGAGGCKSAIWDNSGAVCGHEW